MTNAFNMLQHFFYQKTEKDPQRMPKILPLINNYNWREITLKVLEKV